MTSRGVTLVDVVADPRRVADVDPDQAPAMLAQLAAVQSALAARLLALAKPEPTPAPSTPHDYRRGQLLTPEEAADLLRVDKSWLYRRKTFPGRVELDGLLRFVAGDVVAAVEARAHPGASPRRRTAAAGPRSTVPSA